MGKVYENILNSFRYININKTIFNLYEKVLLFNNFIIEVDKVKKNLKLLVKNKIKKSKSFYKICSTVAKNYENGHYLIIIEKSYPLYQLNLYDL